MKRILSIFAVLLLAVPLAADEPVVVVGRTLATSFDLDGEAADPDQVVVSATLADSTSYTVLANPDICRLVDITVTDADSSITAGVLTVVGTDCWGDPLTTTFTFAAGGSGVKTLVVGNNPDGTKGKASGAYYATVASVNTGVLTGEGVGDALTVGYTGNSPKGWVLYGKRMATASGRRYVSVMDDYAGPAALVKNGAATTDVTAVTANTKPFDNVSVGDIVVFNVKGDIIPRVVASRASADTITINSGVTLPTAGITIRYRKRFFSTDPQDGWIKVQGWDAVEFVFDVDANADTGGVISSVECSMFSVSDPPSAEVQSEVDTATVATGGTGSDFTSIDLRLFPAWQWCRIGIKFGTGDDADAAPEDIDLAIGFRK